MRILYKQTKKKVKKCRARFANALIKFHDVKLFAKYRVEGGAEEASGHHPLVSLVMLVLVYTHGADRYATTLTL